MDEKPDTSAAAVEAFARDYARYSWMDGTAVVSTLRALLAERGALKAEVAALKRPTPAPSYVMVEPVKGETMPQALARTALEQRVAALEERMRNR